MTDENISVLMDEKRVFKPTKEFVNNTNVKQWMDKQNIKTIDDLYKKSDNWEWFWGEIAKELVEWYTPPKKTIEWAAPWVKWFVGAKYNIVHDAVDKHVKTWQGHLRGGGPGSRELPQTLDEHKEMTKQLEVKGEGGQLTRFGFHPLYDQAWLYTWGFCFKGEFQDPATKKITFAHPNNIKAMEYCKGWVDEIGIQDIDAMMASCDSGACDGPNDWFWTGQFAHGHQW